MRTTKKAFTLIEMLIVIVIIGILAAALVPRLVSIQWRARDTKRKADLQQVSSSLAIYKSDNSTFAAMTSGNVSTLSRLVTGGYITSLPTESLATSNAITELRGTAGNYAFMTMTRNSVANNAMVLGAATESLGGSNTMMSGAAAYAITDVSLVETMMATCASNTVKEGTYAPATCTTLSTWMRYHYSQ